MNTSLKNLLSILIILLFIAGQVFIMKKVWSTKRENIELRYGVLSREAIADLSYLSKNQGLDTVLMQFETLIRDYTIAINTVPASLKPWLDKEMVNEFRRIIHSEEDITSHIKRNFTENNLQSDFNHFFVINTLQLYHENKRATELIHAVNDIISTNINESIKLNTFRVETSEYITEIALYIQPYGKERLIVRESLSIILASLFCVSIVLLIYFSTLRNMRKVRKLSTMKTDFMNNLMHELKTPLATISLAGKSLEIDEVLDDKTKITDIAKSISRQNLHLNKLVNHIVDISMWEKEQFSLNKKAVDLKKVLHELVTAFRTGQKDNVTIEEEYSDSLPMARIDVFHFTTLMNNLLSNAVKYSSESVYIKLKLVYNGGFVLKLSDNGNGIPQDDQKYIFDKFYRVNKGNIHAVKGLGLGLYYVRKIVEAHDGTIELQSKLKQGTTFTIHLKSAKNG